LDTHKPTLWLLFDLSLNGEGAHRAISLPIVVKAWNLHVDRRRARGRQKPLSRSRVAE